MQIKTFINFLLKLLLRSIPILFIGFCVYLSLYGPDNITRFFAQVTLLVIIVTLFIFTAFALYQIGDK